MVSWVQKFVSDVVLFILYSSLAQEAISKKILLREICLCFLLLGLFWFEVLHLLYYKIGFILDDSAQLKSNVNALSTL